MSKQPKIKIEETFISKDIEKRKQIINEIFLQIIKKSELHKIA